MTIPKTTTAPKTATALTTTDLTKERFPSEARGASIGHLLRSF